MNLLRYVVGFLLFWKKFIVGDDLRVAATIMWTFLLMFAMAQVVLPIWYVAPVVVVCLIGWLIRDTSPKPKHAKISSRLFWQIVFPLYSVILLPTLYFRIHNDDVTVTHFFIPMSMQLLVCGIYLIIAMPFFRKFPTVVTIATGIVAWWILHPGLMTIGAMTDVIVRAPQFIFVVIISALLVVSVSLSAVRQID